MPRRRKSTRKRRGSSGRRRVSFSRKVKNVHHDQVEEERALGAAFPLVRLGRPNGVAPAQRTRLCRAFLRTYFRRPAKHAAWVEAHQHLPAFGHFYNCFLTEMKQEGRAERYA